MLALLLFFRVNLHMHTELSNYTSGNIAENYTLLSHLPPKYRQQTDADRLKKTKSHQLIYKGRILRGNNKRSV